MMAAFSGNGGSLPAVEPFASDGPKAGTLRTQRGQGKCHLALTVSMPGRSGRPLWSSAPSHPAEVPWEAGLAHDQSTGNAGAVWMVTHSGRLIAPAAL